MFRNALHLSSALAVVCGAYFLYALLAVPMIEGSDVQRIRKTRIAQNTQASTLPDNTYLLRGLIPEDSWEYQGCKILVTTHGIVVFKDYKITEDGRVAVEPFTLIANQDKERLAPRQRLTRVGAGSSAGGGDGPGEKKKSQPIVVRSPKGAMLFFDSQVEKGSQDATGLGFGKLVGAFMPGRVQITRKPTQPTGDDGFEVVTHAVQIEGRTVTAPYDIVFRVGRTRGKGRSLTIVLDGEDTADPNSLTGVKGVRSLELAELEELRIETRGDKRGNDGLFSASKKSPGKSATAQQSTTPESGDERYPSTSPDPYPATAANELADDNWTRVNVYCKGAFKLDFLKSVATFNRQVLVEHLKDADSGASDETAQADTLECDQLAILFDKPFFEDRRKSGDRSEMLISSRSMSPAPPTSRPQLTKLIATGRGAVGQPGTDGYVAPIPATLSLKSRSAVARAGSLEFDVINKRVVLKDKLAVSLRDPQHEIVAPKLEYTLGEEGRMGVGWAPGPGRIEKFATDDEEGFVATWGMDMNIRPHEGKTTISLYERAKIAVGKSGEFNKEFDSEFDAGELHLWLWEIPSESNADRPDAKKKWRLLPAQILATDNVKFSTRQVFGKTQRVQCFWPEPVSEMADETSAAAEETANAKRTGKTGQLFTGQAADEPPTKRWEVATGQANIHLDAQNHLQLLELLDGADIREQSVPYSHDSLVVQGNSLIVAPTNVPDMYNINVIGSPAVITGRKQSLYGNVITLDQQTNRVVIPGEGRMRIEDAGDSLIESTGPKFVDPKEIVTASAKRSLTEIIWKDSLSFDGKVVTLDGDASVKTRRQNTAGELTVIDARGGQIKATIEPAINFRKIDRHDSGGDASSKPEVIELDLTGKVSIKSQTYSQPETLKSIDHLVTDNLRIDTRSGEVASVGAGVVETVRLGKPGKKQQFAGEVLPGSAAGLNYLQVNFAGGFNGNLFRKELTFHRKIRSLYGPVSNWAESLNINQQQSNPKVAFMDCEQLAIGQWRPDPSQKATMEMIAEGNVSIRGATFSSNSDRVSFMEANNMLVIEGSPQKLAQLNYRSTPRGPQQYAEAREIKYWPERGEIAVDQLEKAEYKTEEPVRQQGLPTLPGLKGFQVPGIRGR